MATYLRFARGVAEEKCILVTAVCVSVCLSLAAFPHYCTDPDVTWGNDRGALQLFTIARICNRCTGFVCYENSAEGECQRVLVFALCLVLSSD